MVQPVDRKRGRDSLYSMNLEVTYTKQVQKKTKTYQDGHLVVSDTGIQLLDSSSVIISRMDFSLANYAPKKSLFHKQYDTAVVNGQGLIQGVLDGIIICLDNPPNLPGRLAEPSNPILQHPDPPSSKFVPLQTASHSFHPATHTVVSKNLTTYVPVTRVDDLIDLIGSPSLRPIDPSNFSLSIVNTVYKEIFDSISDYMNGRHSATKSSTIIPLIEGKIVHKGDEILLETSAKFPDFFNIIFAKRDEKIFIFRAISGSHPHSNRADLVPLSTNIVESITPLTTVFIIPNLHCDIRLLDLIRSPDHTASFIYDLFACPETGSLDPIPSPPLSIDIIEDCWDKIMMKFPHFTPEQISVLASVRNWLTCEKSKPVIAIEGCFGSGKSTLLAACISLLASVFDSHQLGIDLSRILFFASTNAAVDSTLLKLRDDLGYENFARIGVVDRVNPALFPFTGNFGTGSSQRPALTPNEWKNHRRIIGTTSASASDLSLPCPFVFIDEGSQLTEVSALVPLLQCSAVRILILGDSHQLAQPCTESVSESVLKKFSKNQNNSETFKLSVQFRCHESVANFCAKFFYDRSLITVRTRSRHSADPCPSLAPINILQHKNRAVRDHGSLKNDHEAKLVVDFIQSKKHLLAPRNRIAIITSYCAQQTCLSEALAVANLPDIPVHTVDTFQGSEAEIVIISLAASDPARSEKFIANPNRLNVALSRAIHKLIVIGNSRIFETIPIFLEFKKLATEISPPYHRSTMFLQ